MAAAVRVCFVSGEEEEEGVPLRRRGVLLKGHAISYEIVVYKKIAEIGDIRSSIDNICKPEMQCVLKTERS
jgi:hypothetical protein